MPEFDHLTHADALRALYIDFEGEKDRTPALLGVHRCGQGARPYVHHDIIIQSFGNMDADAASDALAGVVRKVLERAERRDRRIVAWSEHEPKVIRRDLSRYPELVSRFEVRFANARRIAERWRNKCHGGTKPPTGTLPAYLAQFGYAVSADAAGGDVGATIRDIRHRYEQGKLPTTGQVARWQRVIEHNRHDCIGMRQLCLTTTSEMDAADSARKRQSAAAAASVRPSRPR